MGWLDLITLLSFHLGWDKVLVVLGVAHPHWEVGRLLTLDTLCSKFSPRAHLLMVSYVLSCTRTCFLQQYKPL
jgi:hypothetical protein